MTTFLKTFSSNVLWLSIAEFANKLFLFLGTILLARYLGSHYYGQLAYVISLSSLFAIFSDAGLGTILTREVSRRRTDAALYLNSILSLKLVMLVISICVLLILPFLKNYFLLFLLIFFWMILNYYNDTFRSLFRAFNQFQFEAIGRTIESVSLVVFILFGIFFERGLIFFGVCYFLSGFLGFLYYLVLVIKRGIIIRFNFNKTLWSHLIAVALPLLFINFVLIAYFQISILILGIFRAPSEVGLFQVAYQLAVAFFIIPKIVVGGVFPLLSEYFHSSFEKFRMIHLFIFKLFLVLISFFGPFIAVRSRDILIIFYGDAYKGADIVLSILIWMGLLLMINNLLGQTLIAINKERQGLFTVSVATFVSIILHIILIPPFGLIGAAVAVSISELLFEFITLSFIAKYFGYRSYVRLLVKPLVLGIILATVALLLQDINFWFSGFIYLILAFFITLGIKIFEGSEQSMLKEIVPDHIKKALRLL